MSCSFGGRLAPFEAIELIVSVVVKPGAKPGEVNTVNVSGGEAPSTSVHRAIQTGVAPGKFGVQDFELTPEEAGGGIDAQAGSHPFQLTTTTRFNQGSASLPKDVHVKLPPGLIGNPVPFPRCSAPDFLNVVVAVDLCPPDTAVGIARVEIFLGEGRLQCDDAGLQSGTELWGAREVRLRRGHSSRVPRCVAAHRRRLRYHCRGDQYYRGRKVHR